MNEHTRIDQQDRMGKVRLRYVLNSLTYGFRACLAGPETATFASLPHIFKVQGELRRVYFEKENSAAVAETKGGRLTGPRNAPSGIL
jgi:hypothetical protein